MINKELVKTRFQKQLKTYSENSIVQKEMANKLINLLTKNSFQSVLELGCGSGILTQKLTNKITYENYTAVDIVENCREYISRINADIKFIQSDIENMSFSKKYDLIISNATLQWIENIEGFINELKTHLTPNGVLIFSTFGINNFKEISAITNVGLKYYSKNELEEMLSPQYIEENIIEMEFLSPINVLKHLKLTGVNSITHQHWTKSDLKNFENKYTQLCSNKIKLTYHPMYIIL